MNERGPTQVPDEARALQRQTDSPVIGPHPAARTHARCCGRQSSALRGLTHILRLASLNGGRASRAFTFLCLPLNTTANAPCPTRSFLLYSKSPTASMGPKVGRSPPGLRRENVLWVVMLLCRRWLTSWLLPLVIQFIL